MCTIKIKEILDAAPNLPEAGCVLFDRIDMAFNNSQNVIIDMEDVTSLSSVFLNTSIGRVVEQYGVERLKQSVSFSKITRQQAERLKEYLQKISV